MIQKRQQSQLNYREGKRGSRINTSKISKAFKNSKKNLRSNSSLKQAKRLKPPPQKLSKQQKKAKEIKDQQLSAENALKSGLDVENIEK